jgi:drug/metabolite transporter (DMT)-like permease
MYYIYVWRVRGPLGKKGPVYQAEIEMAKQKGLKTDINVLMFLIPTVIDIVSSTCGFIALNFIEASVYLMLNGAGFIWIVFFSMVILKRRFYRQHLLAFLFILGGVTMVGVASFTHQDPAKRHESKWMGFVFILFTQIFGALFYISEELLFVKYHLNPLKVAGWEGVWGTLIYSVILVILQFINCTGKLCPQGKLDNSQRTFEQFGDNYWLILFTI